MFTAHCSTSNHMLSYHLWYCLPITSFWSHQLVHHHWHGVLTWNPTNIKRRTQKQIRKKIAQSFRTVLVCRRLQQQHPPLHKNKRTNWWGNGKVWIGDKLRWWKNIVIDEHLAIEHWLSKKLFPFPLNLSFGTEPETPSNTSTFLVFRISATLLTVLVQKICHVIVFIPLDIYQPNPAMSSEKKLSEAINFDFIEYYKYNFV